MACNSRDQNVSSSNSKRVYKRQDFMIIFEIESIYLLHIYIKRRVWYVVLSSLFGVISNFKYTKSQYLSYLAHDMLSEDIRGSHVEKFGNPGIGDTHNTNT
jgi:hypothetical protein